MKFQLPLARPNRADRTALPALLAGLLVAMAVAQCALTSATVLPDAGPISGRTGGQIALADAGSAGVAPVIAARPIFAPRGGSAGASESAGAVDPLGGATIAGSVGIGRRAYAMVQAPGGRTLRVPIGGTIAGWRLVALSDSGATLTRGGERITVAFGAPAATDAPGTGEGEQQ